MCDGLKSRPLATEADIDQALREAHASEDHQLLVDLYYGAALFKAGADEPESAAFLYTQAYVFALETGHQLEEQLKQTLIKLGCEAPA